MICTCVRCGNQFESNRKTSVCSQCGTTEVCCVCGKEFELKWPYTAKTCSPECRGKLRKESGQGKEIAKRAHETAKKNNSSNVSLKPKTCEYCGKIFVPTSNRQKYCGDDYGKCPVCGKLIKIKDMNIGAQACSYECRQKLIEKTNQERYGVKNVFQSDEVKEKSKQTNIERYGSEYYQSTDEYRSKYEDTMIERYGVTSPLKSQEIRNKWIETNQKIYGADYAIQNADVRQKIVDSNLEYHGGLGFGSEETNKKIKSTNLETYGVENPMQNDEIKNKVFQTNLETYGFENPMQNKDVQAKRNATNLEIYGSISPLGNEDIKKKAHETVRHNYGVDNVFQSEEIREKIEETNIERYDAPNPMQNEKIKDKAKATNRERYGSDYWGGSDERLKLCMKNPDKIDQFKSFRDDPKAFILDNFDFSPTLNQIAQETGVEVSTVCFHVLDKNCESLVTYNVSSMELEVKNFLLSIDKDIEIVMHDRKQIKPLEIDLYLSQYRIGIECNPTYTHNSSESSFGAPDPIPSNYHRNKSKLCEDNEIFLFHIFGYEWENKKEIILSMIRNLLGKNERVVYGRDTYVCEIEYSEACEFLNANHRQGMTNAKRYLGLRTKDNDELVSLMTFNKLRSSIGKTKDSNKNDIELSRFCNIINTSVVGGASKLFKYYLENYEYDKIVSFSDIAHTRGGLYEKLGFKKVNISEPGYVWVDMKTNRYFNRVQCQKRNLKNLFDEPDLDIENQSETEIMQNHGYGKVFDSGLIRWEYS